MDSLAQLVLNKLSEQPEEITVQNFLPKYTPDNWEVKDSPYPGMPIYYNWLHKIYMSITLEKAGISHLHASFAMNCKDEDIAVALKDFFGDRIINTQADWINKSGWLEASPPLSIRKGVRHFIKRTV